MVQDHRDELRQSLAAKDRESLSKFLRESYVFSLLFLQKVSSAVILVSRRTSRAALCQATSRSLATLRGSTARTTLAR